MKKSFDKVAGLAITHLSKSSKSSNSFVPALTSSFSTQTRSQDAPTKCDICIIGGGAMGSSTAFWLKQHPVGKKLNVVVIERDPKYTKASTVLSLGGIRQQFSNGENVQLSLFGSQFIKNIQEHLGIPGKDPVDIQYHPRGYFFIATNPQGAEILHENHQVQRQFDSKVELITKEQVKKRYPFMNVDDIVLASIGLENEGWFDPWSLLNGFKKKALDLGVQYVTAEVMGFDKENDAANIGPTQLYIKDDQGETKSMEFSQCVVAAGYESGKIGRMAGIGSGKGVLSVPIPVEPKKRYVYYVDVPTLKQYTDVPLVIEPTGTYFRPDGSCAGSFFTGRSPTDEQEPPVDDLEVDYSFFDTDVWPCLANRSKDFENLKIKSAWGGYYDYNTFDQNGIIGTHPVFSNFHFATGFSGHGIQQSPAVGHSIMELILHGSFKTIDLRKFGFERVIEDRKVLERNIV